METWEPVIKYVGGVLLVVLALLMAHGILRRPLCPWCRRGDTFEMDRYTDEATGLEKTGWGCRDCYRTWEAWNG